MSRGKSLVKNIMAAMLTVILLLLPVSVNAAEMSVEFTSKKYDKTSGSEFQAGIKLNSDIALSAYTIVIEYDKSRLKVTDGGQGVDAAQGTVTCTGEGSYLTSIKFWIDFEAISGGDAYITVISADAVGTDGTEYTISNLGTVPVVLRGEDVSEQNLLELDAVNDGADISDSGSDSEMDNSGDESSDSDIDFGENADDNLGEVFDNAATADGETEAPENKGRKALIYWIAVALIIVVLVLIVALPTFGGKRNKKSSEEFMDVEALEDEQGLIFDGEEENLSEEDEDNLEVADSDYEPLVGNDPFEEMSVVDNEPFEEMSAVDNEPFEEMSAVDNEPFEEEADVDDELLEEMSAADNESFEETPEDENSETEEIPDVTEADTNIQPVEVTKSETGEVIFEANKVTVRCKVRSKNPARTDFDIINVLDGISVKLGRGELVEITGTSNRELEAFIYLLAGKCKIRSGSVDKAPKRCRVVTAKSCFDPRLTVRANIYRSGALMGHPKTTLDKCFSRIVKFAGAEDLTDKYAGNVSMTTVHKLEVALALLDDRADVLILGNVLDKCDETFVRKCNVILGKMIAKDITVLLFGVIPETIAVNCTRTIRIINGHITEQ